MTLFTRTPRLSAVRTGLGVLVFGLLTFAICWAAGDLPAQHNPGGERRQARQAPPNKRRPRVEEEEKAPARPVKRPRVEEEEEGGGKPKKVIRVDEEDTKPPPAPAVPPVADLLRAAEQARHPAVKELFRDLAVPHDKVTFRGFDGVTTDGEPRQKSWAWFEPIPLYADNPDSLPNTPLTLRRLDSKWNPVRADRVSPRSIQSITYYEQIAQKAVRDFLDKHYAKSFKDWHLDREDQLQAAEQALAAVIRFHESARERGIRRGEGWESVENGLRRELLNVLLEKLDALAQDEQWNEAFALTTRLARTYPDSEDQVKIAGPLARLLEEAVNKPPVSGTEQLRKARQRLRLLAEQFPDNPKIKPIAAKLRDKAQELYDKAQPLLREGKDLNRAQDLLREAEETWPQLPGLHKARIEVSRSYPVLRVGMRSRPQYLSPGWACTDAELRAVELLFESLVKASPDASGVFHYHPGLAERPPQVKPPGQPAGRGFRLPRNACWSDGKPLTAVDVRATVDLLKLKQGKGTGRPPAWGELLKPVEVHDPYHADLILSQGYLDPLALMTFKVLPQGAPVDTKEFAESPVGSGPYRLDGRRSEESRPYVGFVANPRYGQRASKFGLPHIREVRFFLTADPVQDLERGRLDLALDLTADEADALRQKPDHRFTVPLPEPDTPNRRVWFLAVNHRRPALANVNVRRALARAVNREEILDKCFRGALQRRVHKAINGPYPAGSWACNPALRSRDEKNSLDPYYCDLAASLIKQAAREGVRDIRLTLTYPTGDPQVEKAMAALCEQLKAVGIQLTPAPRDPWALRADVEETNSYDLAYYHYDFPDATYWLGPLFCPTGRAGGDNYLGYQSQVVEDQLENLKRRRHFADVQKATHVLHRLLYDEMPLIPLWQLDPLCAYSARDIEPVPFDPLLVFPDIEQWKRK